jgi:hypothetical protein
MIKRKEKSASPVIPEPVYESMPEPVVETASPVIPEPVVETASPVIPEPVVETVPSVIPEPVVQKSAPPAPSVPPAPKPVVYVVAPGKSVTCKKGIINSGKEINPEWVYGGVDTLNNLVTKKIVIKG